MARSKDLATEVVRSRHCTAVWLADQLSFYPLALVARWATSTGIAIPADAVEQHYASGSLVLYTAPGRSQALRRRRTSVGPSTGRRPLHFNTVGVPVNVDPSISESCPVYLSQSGTPDYSRVYNTPYIPDSKREQNPAT